MGIAAGLCALFYCFFWGFFLVVIYPRAEILSLLLQRTELGIVEHIAVRMICRIPHHLLCMEVTVNNLCFYTIIANRCRLQVVSFS